MVVECGIDGRLARNIIEILRFRPDAINLMTYPHIGHTEAIQYTDAKLGLSQVRDNEERICHERREDWVSFDTPGGPVALEVQLVSGSIDEWLNLKVPRADWRAKPFRCSPLSLLPRADQVRDADVSIVAVKVHDPPIGSEGRLRLSKLGVNAGAHIHCCFLQTGSRWGCGSGRRIDFRCQDCQPQHHKGYERAQHNDDCDQFERTGPGATSPGPHCPQPGKNAEYEEQRVCPAKAN